MTYIEKQIFADNRLNIMADRLLYFFVQDWTSEALPHLILSGKAAKELQETTPAAINNFVFVLSNPKIYEWVVANASKLNAKQTYFFKERILFEFEYCQMEIWILTSSITAVNYDSSGIFIHTKTEIPNSLL